MFTYTLQRSANSRRYTFQLKLIVTTLVLAFTSTSAGCIAARGGSEYDALLEIQRLAGGEYRLTFPRQIKNLRYGASAALYYYKDAYEREGRKNYRVPELEYALELEFDETDYFAKFSVKSILQLTPYVVVFWTPRTGGECGAIAESDDLTSG